MFDSLERLQSNSQLLQLFSHYARLGAASPEAWHLRLSEMESSGRQSPSSLPLEYLRRSP